jgi:hypothetical protein
MLNAFDYYQNETITSRISLLTSKIQSREDKEDCQQEIWAELYDFMPITTDEALTIIERVAKKYKRTRHAIYNHEVSFEEAGT